jgi:hypothetical protein
MQPMASKTLRNQSINQSDIFSFTLPIPIINPPPTTGRYRF